VKLLPIRVDHDERVTLSEEDPTPPTLILGARKIEVLWQGLLFEGGTQASQELQPLPFLAQGPGRAAGRARESNGRVEPGKVQGPHRRRTHVEYLKACFCPGHPRAVPRDGVRGSQRDVFLLVEPPA
jgi:hypothetical protein